MTIVRTMQSFVALDVETANPDYSSICAVGLCRFQDGLVVDEWYRLLDPRTDFHWKQIEIHGIREQQVAGQPCFPEVVPEMAAFVGSQTVIHHGHFDRSAIGQASERWHLPPPKWGFIDSLLAAKQAWPDRRADGYRLPDLCQNLGHELVHHHSALDDARAAGAVLLAASDRLGDERIATLVQRLPATGKQPQLWSDDTDLSLQRDVIVFSRDATASSHDPELLATLKRRGALVQKRLTDNTTIYVLSNEEWREGATTGQRQTAARKIGSGQRLQIMSERDFTTMIEYA